MRDRARSSIAGRQAEAAGSNFEEWLNLQHELAGSLGILACIDKIDPPAVVHKGRVEFGPKTVSDYIGMLDGGAARYLAVEAKSTLKHYLPKREVTKLQQEHLTTTARGGGLALLVEEFRGQDHGRVGIRRYAVPWLEVPWQVLKTAESVSEDALYAGGWQISGCYLERWHPRGTSSTPPKMRTYARE